MASPQTGVAFLGKTLFVCAVSTLAAAQLAKISRTVKDSSGAAVTSAQVTLHSAHKTESARTDSAGRFEFDLSDLTGTVEVNANGFTPTTQTWFIGSGNAEVNIVLQPLAANERVIVSASRSEMKLSEIPGSAVLLSSNDLAANAALTTDDMLRQDPGFALFRRSRSRVADPTTH